MDKKTVKQLVIAIERNILLLRAAITEVTYMNFGDGCGVGVSPAVDGEMVHVFYKDSGTTAVDYTDEGLNIQVFNDTESTPLRELSFQKVGLKLFQDDYPGLDAIGASISQEGTESSGGTEDGQKSVTVYFDVHPTSDNADSPSYAMVNVTKETIATLRDMQKACVGLSECRRIESPDAWLPASLSDELRLTGDELCVGGGSFWFIAAPKDSNYYVETEMHSIDGFVAIWENTASGSTIELVNYLEVLREVLEDESDVPA